MLTRQSRVRGVRRVAGPVVVFLGGVVAGCEVPTDLPKFESMFVVSTERLAVPVVAQPVSVALTHDMAEARDLVNRTRGGAIVVEVENGSLASGRVDLRISNGQVDVMASIDSQGSSRQRIPLTLSEVQSLLGSMVTLRASGTLCPANGCATTVAAVNVVTLRAQFELLLEVGS